MCLGRKLPFEGMYNIVRLVSFNKHLLNIGCVPLEVILHTFISPSCDSLVFFVITSILINVLILVQKP